MHGQNEFRVVLPHIAERAVTLLAFGVVFAVIATSSAQPQTFSVIHHFTGGADQNYPFAGLAMDAAGNLYGTTCGNNCLAGAYAAGTVFRLSKHGSSWAFTTLYSFRGGNDGTSPYGPVVIGPDGTLYGTTYQGGGSGCGGAGCGTVFNLKPPANSVTPSVFGGWTETVLYSFQGGASDGAYPALANLTFDSAGNIYGTTASGGAYDAGTVFKLTRSASGWTESLLHNFTGGNDGNEPLGGLIIDGGGNLYGATMLGGGSDGFCLDGYSCGVIFELSPSPSGWTETVVQAFYGDGGGGNPIGGLAQGAYGIIGTTSLGGYNGGGTAFVLNNQLFQYSFIGDSTHVDWPGPWSSLVYGPVGAPGVAYGTTFADGGDFAGSVFYMYGCAGWDAVSLHDFTGGRDGAYPAGGVIFDNAGNLFGTTLEGGAYGGGVVFEIAGAGNSPVHSPGCAAGQ